MPALEARGVELSWSERGKGVPVVLIHETATTSSIWTAVARALSGGSPISEGARVISYDRRGWGASSAPDGYQRTTIEEQSEDAAVLAESLGATPALLCGAGLGAVIALDLLLRRPELVSAALLIEPTVFALLPDATVALSDDRVELEGAVRDHGVYGAVTLYLSGGLRALGAGSDRLPAALTGEARRRPASLFAELGAAAAWSMPLVRLAGAQRPSLIVTAPSTPSLLRDGGHALAGRLNRSETTEIEVDRTPPHVGAPEEVARLVLGLAGG
jgi:pimeloyl-ACP methyl ester carboxylesterase